MPRRLGDDPLSRAKAATAPAPASADGVSQVAVRSSSRPSYNDVFFQRRAADEGRPLASSVVTIPSERAEISEISEIPEMKEVAAAPIVQAENVAPPTPEPAAAVSVIEVATVNAAVVESTSSVAYPVPQPVPVPSAAAASPSQSNGEKSGGFLKRLFGRFGK